MRRGYWVASIAVAWVFTMWMAWELGQRTVLDLALDAFGREEVASRWCKQLVDEAEIALMLLEEEVQHLRIDRSHLPQATDP